MFKKIIRKIVHCRRAAAHEPLNQSNVDLSIHPTAKVSLHNIHGPAHCSLEIGEMSTVEGHIFLELEGARVCIGSRTFIGSSALHSAVSITVGDDVLVSFGCCVADHDSHSVDFVHRQQDVTEWYHGRKDWTYVKRTPVVIGDKVWIGMHVIITEGVTIGEGAVVGAGSVVTHDVLPWTIVAGNPARLIRHLVAPAQAPGV